jgi:hypothetical protein
MRVKAYIQESATEPAPDTVVKAAVELAKKALDGQITLFNLKKNPTELDLGAGCEAAFHGDLEYCANLAGLAPFASVEADLHARLDSFRTAAVPSTFAWEDDGALASPQLFGNLWTPWRDLEGAPKLVFTGLHKGEGSSAFVAGSTAAIPDTSKAFATLSHGPPAAPMSLSAALASAATGAGKGELAASLVGAVGAVALVVGAAFRAGAASAKRGQEYTAVPTM